MPPTIRHFDTQVVNYFLNKFVINMASSFATFQDFNITTDTIPDVILSMAAVGGVCSRLDGSFQIAQAMYNDARRLVLGRVRIS